MKKKSTLDRNLLTSSLWHANKTSSRWQYRIHVVWSSYGLLASWLAENTRGRKFFGTFLGGPPIESLQIHRTKNRRTYKLCLHFFLQSHRFLFWFLPILLWYLFLPTLIEPINIVESELAQSMIKVNWKVQISVWRIDTGHFFHTSPAQSSYLSALVF